MCIFVCLCAVLSFSLFSAHMISLHDVQLQLVFCAVCSLWLAASRRAARFMSRARFASLACSKGLKSADHVRGHRACEMRVLYSVSVLLLVTGYPTALPVTISTPFLWFSYCFLGFSFGFAPPRVSEMQEIMKINRFQQKWHTRSSR